MKTLLIIVLLLVAFLIILSMYMVWSGQSGSIVEQIFGWIKDFFPSGGTK